VDDGLEAPIDKGIEVEIRAFDQVIRTEDAAEGLQAFFQKRPPQFRGR
jgi:enoyl-CoA hydratase